MNQRVNELFPFPKNWIDEDTRVIAEAIHKWVDKEIINNRLEYQKAYHDLFYSRRKSHNLDIGFQKIIFPEKYGGSGFNTLEKTPALVSILIELSRADAGLGFMSALEYAVSAIAVMEPNVNDEVCDLIAPFLCEDRLSKISIIMPGSGFTSEETSLYLGRSVNAVVTPVKKGYILNGKNLRPLGNGAAADFYCVVCSDPEKKVGLAFLKGDSKGIKCGVPIKQTGLNECINSDVSFDNVEISEKYIIFGEDVVNEAYTWLNLFLGSVSLGACLNFFEILSDWSNNRVIKGKGLIKENPLCASVLATVAEEIGLAKILVYNVSNFIGKTQVWGGHSNPVIFMAAKMFGKRIQESAMNAINRGMELMASAGYAREWHAEKHWRDVKTIQSCLCGTGAEIPVQMDIARYFYECEEI